ncbi:MAG: hypothetical protein J0I32_20095 [Sphingobacteriales bacterium]|nr:hypothetical protein [Sphingobacteriales bacterium]OJV98811.1 MAG: hypothetical protein BGO52_08560 [Sphingobacteriales bacterium 44-61]
MQQLAELQTIYPGLNKDLNELLKGISKDTLLRIMTHLMGMETYGTEEDDTLQVIESWFSESNQGFAQEAYDRIMNYEERHGVKLKIVHVISCLQILQRALELEDDGALDTKSKEESEIDLFYAMLLLNQHQDYNQTKDKEKTKKMFPDSWQYMAALLLNYNFPTSDIINFHFKDYAAAQVHKALMLFKFLESSTEGKALLQRLYKYYQINDWREYIAGILPIIAAWSKRDKASSVDLVLEKNDKYQDNLNFLQRFAMDNYAKQEDVDFRKLRESPLLKLDDHTFRVIHPLFIADKIYKGLYFLLNQLNSEKPPIINAFRSWYTTHFSEGVCLKNILTYAFPKTDALLFDEDMKKQHIIGPPDAYLRQGGAAFLFENKDILINAAIKEAYDLEQLMTEIDKKLVVKEGKPIGIGQLITNIRKLLNQENQYDPGFDKDTSVIYPILITHDKIFDTAGLNQVLHGKFNAELQQLTKEGLDTSRIRPLIIMNIDVLMEMAPLLRKGQITLKEVCEAYYAHCQPAPRAAFLTDAAFVQAMQDKMISFTDFIPHYLTDKLRTNWRSEDLFRYLFRETENQNAIGL